MTTVPEHTDTALHEVPPLTADQQHAAALTVVTRATGMDDARHLLGSLGLLEVDRE